MPSTSSYRLLAMIQERYGLHLDIRSVKHLSDVAGHYEATNRHLVETLGEIDAINHPRYAKSKIISEAAKMILREIMPRSKKKRRPKTKPTP